MGESDWQRFDRDWCAAMAPWRGRTTETATAALFESLLGDIDAAGIADQLIERTAELLQAQAAPRAQAVGLWLGGTRQQTSPSGPELLARAERSRDPMVAALAVQAGAGDAARRQAAALWRELEPNNLAALMAAQDFAALPVPEWLQRLARATSNTMYRKEAVRLVYAVPPPSRGGMTELSLQVAVVGRHAAAVFYGFGALSRACRGTALQGREALCAEVAAKVWDLADEDMVSAQAALLLVRDMPASHAAWTERAERSEAIQGLESALPSSSVDALHARMACAESPVTTALMVDRLVQGDRAFYEARLPTDPAALRALIQASRNTRGGRSVLAPRPHQAAASTPK